MGVWTGTVPTILPGYIVTGDDWKNVLDIETALTSAPTAYTPTWSTTGTAPALVDGTLTGTYTRLQKLVLFQIAFTAGASTTFGTGTWSFTIPVNGAAHSFSALGRANDGGTWYAMQGVYSGPNNLILVGGTMTAVTNTSPFTWGSGDGAYLTGWYWLS